MSQQMYKVQDVRGTWSPPQEVGHLYDLARRGFLKPDNLLHDLQDGRVFPAHEHAALRVIFEQKGYLKPPTAAPDAPHVPKSHQPVHPVGNKKAHIQQQPGTHNPALAAVFSFIIPGLGQGYNRQWGKAVLHFVATGIIIVFGGWLGLLPWLVSVLDAGVIATRINRGESVGLWDAVWYRG